MEAKFNFDARRKLDCIRRFCYQEYVLLPGTPQESDHLHQFGSIGVEGGDWYVSNFELQSYAILTVYSSLFNSDLSVFFCERRLGELAFVFIML